MKRKKGFLYIMGVGMAMSALLASCADDESFSTSRGDVLSFSVDTLKMDTTFSNVPTPTRSFWVYNHTGKALRCQSVRLENGNQKGYRVNVDGSYLGTEAGFQTQNVEIRKGDSIRVFVELTSAMQNSEEPQLVSDNLVFALESGVEQKVNLRAFSWDAMKLNSLEVKQDQLLESTLPVVVYGGIRVDEAATLTIAPGTQLYFHENAGLQVFGSLKIEGENEHGAETRQHARNNADQHSPIILLQKLNLLIKRHSQTDGGWCEQIADTVGARRIGLVIYARQQERDDNEDDGDEQRVHQRPSRLQLQQHAYAVGSQTDENAEEDRILEQLVHFFASFPFLITNCVIQPEAPITTKVLTTVTTIYWNHALPIS